MKESKFITIGLLAFFIVMRLASVPTANLSYILLALYALLGRKQVVQAFALSFLFTMVSPGIAPDATQGALFRYIVIFAASLSVLVRSNILRGIYSLHRTVVFTTLLGIFLIIHSLMFSVFPSVSVIKAISWSLVITTLLSAWLGLDKVQREELASWIFSGLVFILIVSLPFLMHPLGYLRNGSGFQGILNHPQTFGPVMAMLGTWAVSEMLSKTRVSWWMIGLAGLCIFLVLLSEARTAGVALVLGVAFAVVNATVLSGKSLKYSLPGLRSKKIRALLFFSFFSAFFMAPKIKQIFQNYISKSGRQDGASGLTEAYDESRGRLIDAMLNNISERPFTGIGFGISSDPSDMTVVYDPLLGLPISAAIEKGVMPLAVLEELGIIGFLLVASWMFVLLRKASKRGITPVAVATTALLLNMGESIFFSPGGLGMLVLILISWAFSSEKHQQRI